MFFLSNIYLTVRYFYTLIYPSISSISLINLIAIKGNKSSTRYLQRFRNFLPRCLSTIHRFVHNLFLTSFALISSVFFSLSLSFLPPLCEKFRLINAFHVLSSPENLTKNVIIHGRTWNGIGSMHSFEPVSNIFRDGRIGGG